MSNEKALERIYDLLEQHDFESLSESDKNLVLEHMSHEEYKEMRSTVIDTRHLFNKYPMSSSVPKSGNHFSIKHITMFPVKLYKVAAVAILFICFGFALGKISNGSSHPLLVQAPIDTVLIEKVDTVFSVKYDTIRVFKKLMAKSRQPIHQNAGLTYHIERDEAKPNLDCSRVLCPNDIEIVNRNKNENNFSKDAVLKEFIVSLN
jgi:hypothetical protein